MSTAQPLPVTTAATPHSGHLTVTVPADSKHEPPDHLPFTAAVLRAFRRHGWTIAEQRSGRWHYLILRGHDQSAVYKLIGPLFDATGSYYQGYRIA
jgi:hypothetical protein